MRTRLSIATATAAAVLAIAPASALAIDTFVDPDTGDDANNCTQAAPGGAGVGPCLTVAGGIAKAVPTGGTVRIDRGDTYPEAFLALSGGVSLVGQDLAGPDTGPAIIDPGAGTAVTVNPGQSAGTIQGLTLRGNDFGAVLLGSVAQVTQNTFDDPSPDNVGLILAGNTLANSNTFIGDGVSSETAISIQDGAATVSGNTISGHFSGITVNGTGGAGPTSTPVISSNTITGTHQVASVGGAIGAFQGSTATIIGNTIAEPGTGINVGISVNGFSEPATTGVTLRRNRVLGAYSNGIDIRDTGLPATLDGDLVTGATVNGLNFEDQAAPSPAHADVTATNVTAWGNAQDITLVQNVLTLDSSIVEDPITTNAATCAISFSRGPAIVPGGDGCGIFQTTADPQFVDPAGGNLHLQPGSPMIDAGNPAAPGAGLLDIDGEPRALDPTPACTPAAGRRDIGADEFVATPPASCFPPTVVAGPVPIDPPAPAKKCKKGRKLKKGKCVKKKRKRKKN